MDDAISKALSVSQQARNVSPAMMARMSKPSNEDVVKKIRDGNIPTAPNGLKITNLTLASAFDQAIAHHLSLSPDERKANSLRAEDSLAKYLGRTKMGKVKDLLGKNQKLLKSEEGYKGGKPIELEDGRGVETTGLPLSPAYQEGNFNLCPNHQPCKDLCLGLTSGNYHKLGGGLDLSAMKGPRLNSLLKTLAFLHEPHNFAVKLHDEITAAKKDASENSNKLGMRLNVLSDIPARVHRAIIKSHPDVDFYDYTKLNADPIASNHHYTYSSHGLSQPDVSYDIPAREADASKNITASPRRAGVGVHNPNQNWHDMRDRLDKGDNVAMAFSHKRFLPKEMHDTVTDKRYQVVDGDKHDYRPLDKVPEGSAGVIVGLRNKKVSGTMANAAGETNGFFVHYDPMLQKPDKYERAPSEKISEKTGKPVLGKILNPAFATNHVVSIAPQGPKKSSNQSSETGLGGMPQSFARGGFARSKSGLSEEDFMNQFPGLEHHTPEEGEDENVRRKWWEPRNKSGKNPLVDRAMGLIANLRRR